MRNLIVLNGDAQAVRVPFRAEVRGTSAAETVRVPAEGDVRFAGNTGDRVEFAQPLAAYDISARGNEIVVAAPDGSRAEIALNAETDLAFADGSTTARITLQDGRAAVTMDGETVDAGFTTDAVALDASDPAAVDSDDPPSPASRPDIAVSVADAPELDGLRQPIREAARTAWDAWADHLDTAAPATFDLAVAFDARFNLAAFSNPVHGTGEMVDGREVSRTEFGRELRLGFDPQPNSPDATVTLGANLDDLEFAEGAQRGQTDAVSAFTHHIGHFLGITTLRDDFDDRVSPFETHIDDGIFTGEAAGSVAITDETPGHHLAPGGPRTAMMDFPREGQIVAVSETELAILSDIGLPVADDVLG